MRQEVRLFAGMSAFGIGVGIAYWFLTYDWTGTVLLVLFGVGGGLAAVAEVVWARGAGRRGTGRPVEPQRVASARPATAAGGQLPRPGWAPLGIALGLGGVALGGAFGPAIAVAGILVTLSSARAWLAAEVRETDDAHRAERPSSDQDAAAGRSPADRGGPDVASEGS